MFYPIDAWQQVLTLHVDSWVVIEILLQSEVYFIAKVDPNSSYYF